MAAPAGNPAIVQTDEGMKVTCTSHNGEQFVVGPLSAKGEPKAGSRECWAADLICDILAVKLALDAGRPLEGLHLHSSKEPFSSAALPAGCASELCSLPCGELVQQLQHAVGWEVYCWPSIREGQDEAVEAALALLRMAACTGSAALAQLLLLLAPAAATPGERLGPAPLAEAARRGHTAVMRVLLTAAAAAGGAPEAACGSSASESPVHAAAATGQLPALQLLLSMLPASAALAAHIASGQLPLHMAAIEGEAEVVELLLAAAPDAALAKCSAGRLPLHEAATSDSIETVLLLLQAAPEAATALDGQGEPPLFAAASAGRAAALRVLLAAAPEMAGMRGYRGRSLLHAAVGSCSEEAVAAALEAAPGLAVRVDEGGGTPAHSAAEEPHAPAAVMRALLAAAPEAAGMPDQTGFLPLHVAAETGSCAAMQALLAAAPHTALARNNDGLTPMHSAAVGGQVAATALLLQAAPRTAGALTDLGFPPMLYAVLAGEAGCVALLAAAAPATATQPNPEDGWQAIHLAARQGNVATIRAVLHAAPAALTARTALGSTPLMLAAVNGRVEAVRALVALPGAVEAEAGADSNAIVVAAEVGQLEVLQILLAASPAVNGALATPSGRTVMHSAAQGGSREVVEFLLSHPATASLAEATDSDGETPLHLACLAGREAAACALLRGAPARARVRNAEGRLPLHAAVYAGCEPLVRRLIAAAPDLLGAVDRKAWSPLCFAAQQGNPAVVGLLLDAAPSPQAAALAASARGGTPLHIAAMCDDDAHLATARLLLRAAPSAALHPSQAGETPLHVAAAKGCPRMAALLAAAAPRAVTAVDLDGHTPLHEALARASEDKRAATVRALLPVGPDTSMLYLLNTTRPASLPFFADFIIARPALSMGVWALVPSPCPGLGRALPTALTRSPEQAGRLVAHLPPADVQRLRTFVLALHRAQARTRIYLPQPLVWRMLSLFDVP